MLPGMEKNKIEKKLFFSRINGKRGGFDLYRVISLQGVTVFFLESPAHRRITEKVGSHHHGNAKNTQASQKVDPGADA